MGPNCKAILSYVFNSKLNDSFNFDNRRETIESKYFTKALKLNKRSFFVNEDSDPKNHFLLQVYENAVLYKSNYIVIGQQGLKGPRGDRKLFDIGMETILKDTRFPTILIQEPCFRRPKDNKYISWLFVVDRKNQKSKKILKTFLPLVDPEYDYVKCINLLPEYLDFDDVEEEFLIQMKYFNIKNYNYEVEICTNESYAKQICEMVNFGEENFNFVCFYHNQEKYFYNPENCDSKTMIYKIKANLCITY